MARLSYLPPGNRAADVGPGEELVVADDQGRGVDQVEARPDPAHGADEAGLDCARLGVGEDLAQPLDLGRVVAGDQHAVAGRCAIELGLDLGQVAREPLDALDPQVAGGLERIGRQSRDRDRWETGSGARRCSRPCKARVGRRSGPGSAGPLHAGRPARSRPPRCRRERSRSAARSWRGSFSS